MAKVCILGGGFIGRFYAESLCGRRGKDIVTVVYSRKKESLDFEALKKLGQIEEVTLEEIFNY